MFSSFISLFSGIFLLLIAFIFHRAIDGMLRKCMIAIFLSMGLVQILRAIFWTLPDWLTHRYLDLLNLIIVLPILVAAIYTFFYLYFSFFKKQKNVSQHIIETAKEKTKK